MENTFVNPFLEISKDRIEKITDFVQLMEMLPRMPKLSEADEKFIEDQVHFLGGFWGLGVLNDINVELKTGFSNKLEYLKKVSGFLIIYSKAFLKIAEIDTIIEILEKPVNSHSIIEQTMLSKYDDKIFRHL